MNRLTYALLGLLACGAVAFASNSDTPGGPGGGQPPPDIRAGDAFNDGWNCANVWQDSHGQHNVAFATPDGPSVKYGVGMNTAGTGVVDASPWRGPDGKPRRIKGGRLQKFNQGHGRWINVSEVPPSGLFPDGGPHWLDELFTGPGDDIGSVPTEPPPDEPDLFTYWPKF